MIGNDYDSIRRSFIAYGVLDCAETGVVAESGDVRTGKAARLGGEFFTEGIERVNADAHFGDVMPENSCAAFFVRERDFDDTVESAWTEEGAVDSIPAICRADNEYLPA